MAPDTITLDDKLTCLRRELALRKAVYGKRVREGRMASAMAEWELAVMEAILKDYQAEIRPSANLDGADGD